jgi:2-amino-4-hydroxy-6-hydroxymethyldihydropteridine diphosphokinase
MAEPVTAYLGLGGNVGDVAQSMRDALKLMDENPGCRVVETSPVYRTPPWGPVEQDWFLNACAAVETELPAADLLGLVLATERELGRIREERWGPRTIDVDILLYGDSPVSTEALTIPHPRMTDRAFVMVPLADLAGWLHLNGHTITSHAAKFADDPLEKTDITIWD